MQGCGEFFLKQSKNLARIYRSVEKVAVLFRKMFAFFQLKLYKSWPKRCIAPTKACRCTLPKTAVTGFWQKVAKTLHFSDRSSTKGCKKLAFPRQNIDERLPKSCSASARVCQNLALFQQNFDCWRNARFWQALVEKMQGFGKLLWKQCNLLSNPLRDFDELWSFCLLNLAKISCSFDTFVTKPCMFSTQKPESFKLNLAQAEKIPLAKTSHLLALLRF